MIAANGATVYTHYCMEERLESSLFANEAQVCSNCGMEKQSSQKSTCCKDERTQFKVNEAHQQTSAGNFIFKTLSLPLVFLWLSIPDAEQLELSTAHPKAEHALIEHANPLYLRNCVFII